MLSWFFTLPLCLAQTPQEILETAMAKQRVNNSIQTVEMRLVAKNGGIQQRRFELKIRKDKEVVRSYTRFTYPPEIENTQLVVIDKPNTNDPQLMYLPALKRVQRIAGRSRKGSFMGSDFSFADLELSIDKDAKHEIVGETDTRWVIKTKTAKHPLYSAWISRISKKNSLPESVTYFDKKDQKLKTIVIEKTQEFNGTLVPVPREDI